MKSGFVSNGGIRLHRVGGLNSESQRIEEIENSENGKWGPSQRGLYENTRWHNSEDLLN